MTDDDLLNINNYVDRIKKLEGVDNFDEIKSININTSHGFIIICGIDAEIIYKFIKEHTNDLRQKLIKELAKWRDVTADKCPETGAANDD